MEAAGLGFGVASLYGATLDILNRVSSYKEYHHESQAVLARYYGSKARLQEWASGVGIENGKLKEGHNRLLDSPQAAAVVQNTLKCLRQLFDEGEDAKQLASSPSAQHSSQSVDWVIPPELPTIASPNEPPNLSSRRRLAWAVGGKSRLSKIVQNFEGLVTILFNVVPPVDVENTLNDIDKKLDLLLNFNEGVEELLDVATIQKQKGLEDWLEGGGCIDPRADYISQRLEGTCT